MEYRGLAETVSAQLRSLEPWHVALDVSRPLAEHVDALESSVRDHVAEAVDVDEDEIVVGGDAGLRDVTLVASITLSDGQLVNASFKATIQRFVDGATIRPTGEQWSAADLQTTDTSGAVVSVESQAAVNPVGAGLALLGGVLVLVGSFVPVHSLGLVPIPNNSFVSDGDWWILAIPLTMGVTAAYVLLGSAGNVWAIVVPSLVAIGVGIYGQTSKFQTLQLSALGRQLFGQSSVKASAGAGVWLVLAGGVLGLAGAGLVSGRWRPAGVSQYERRTKKCPDCAETVLADANVCKHCGYRFDAR